VHPDACLFTTLDEEGKERARDPGHSENDEDKYRMLWLAERWKYDADDY
jgi:hypothetical protein